VPWARTARCRLDFCLTGADAPGACCGLRGAEGAALPSSQGFLPPLWPHDACWSAPGLRTASSAARHPAETTLYERARRLLWFVALVRRRCCPISCRRCSIVLLLKRLSLQALSPSCGGSATWPRLNGAHRLPASSVLRSARSVLSVQTWIFRHALVNRRLPASEGVPARPHHCRFRGGRDRPAAGSRQSSLNSAERPHPACGVNGIADGGEGHRSGRNIAFAVPK
jgi:hypothetical protein